jgi:hypothetical protein
MAFRIEDVSKRMQSEGFEYCAMVTTLSLDAYSGMCSMGKPPSMKPRGSVLNCSRLETVDDTNETVPQWFMFVEGEDFHKEDYSRRHLIFVRIDPSRVANESNTRFCLGGDWRYETDFMPMIHWQSVAAEFDGITVDPARFDARSVFPMWDVDTLSIWDRACITHARAFKNAGEWMYSEETVLC